MYRSIVGSVVECSPATRAARVRFPDDANFFFLFLAFHRGYMRQCYHAECDNWRQELATEERYKFMAATAQSLVLSVAEMSMEGHENSCIKQTVQHIVKKAQMIKKTGMFPMSNLHKL